MPGSATRMLQQECYNKNAATTCCLDLEVHSVFTVPTAKSVNRRSLDHHYINTQRSQVIVSRRFSFPPFVLARSQ